MSNNPTWHCIRCKRDFPDLPTAEMPYARETQRDPKTGRPTISGEICRECYEPEREPR